MDTFDTAAHGTPQAIRHQWQRDSVMPDETFVIVGPDGTEHEFPTGMDPKRAAAIVRGEKPSAPTPQPESATPTLYNQPVGQSLLDIGTGALGQAWETAKSVGMAMEDPAGSLLKLLASQPKELYDIHAKGEEARHQGRTSEAIGYHAAGMLPIIGPGIVAAAENIGSAEPERVGRGFIDTANVGLGSRGVIPSATTATQGARAAGGATLDAVNRAARHPTAPLIAATGTGLLTGGLEGGLYGLGIGSTPGIVRIVKGMLTPAGAEVAPGVTASQLPRVSPPALGTLRGPTGAQVSGPGVPTSQSPVVRPPGRGKLRSYGNEEPSPRTGPGVPTSEHKKVRAPAQRERTIDEEVSERPQPSEPVRREVEKQLGEEAKAAQPTPEDWRGDYTSTKARERKYLGEERTLSLPELEDAYRNAVRSGDEARIAYLEKRLRQRSHITIDEIKRRVREEMKGTP